MRTHVSTKQHNTTQSHLMQESFSELFCCSLRVSLNCSHQNSCRAKHFSLHSYFQGCLIYEATTSLLIHSSILTLCCQWMRYGKFPINSTVLRWCAVQFLTSLLHQALCAQWTNNRRAEGVPEHFMLPFLLCAAAWVQLCALVPAVLSTETQREGVGGYGVHQPSPVWAHNSWGKAWIQNIDY